MTVAVLVGLQASGKTTFAATARFDGWERLSKDDWPNARHRQQRLVRRLGEAVAAGRDVVVDNTNPSPTDWEPLVTVARAGGTRAEAWWFPPDPAGSWARNQARPQSTRVPEIGLRDVLAKLTAPTRAAGFDDVFTVRFDGAGGFVVEQEVT